MQNNKDIQKGETVQAVIIADSFDSKFGPLTTTKPRCLMPLGDRPILSYTLEFLKISGVQECFVFCTSFAQDIKTFLNEWTGDQGSNVMTITPIIHEECRSFGDAMRDLDAQGVLRQDFILLFGDCVGNVNLSSILQEHKARSKEDKNAIMTMVYGKAMPGHHLRTVKNEVFLAVNEKHRILHHARTAAFGQKNFKVPLEVFQDDIVDLKFDLLDLGIAICTQAVPALFADNFDNQTLDEFIIGVLQDGLTDYALHMHQLDNAGYSARVTDFHTFFGVHRDLLHRWLYPIVPEISSGKKSTNLVYNRHNIYKGQKVDLKKGSYLEQDVLVADGSHVGENSTLFKAVIGHNTHIGKDVSIRDSIIGVNVTIGEGCQLFGCVIGDNATIGNNVTINSRCVLGDHVEIPDNSQLPSETWLVSQKPETGFSDDEDEEDLEESVNNYGPKAIVFKDEDEEENDDESDAEIEGIRTRWGLVNLEPEADDCDEDSDTDSETFSDIDHEIDIEIDPDANFKTFHGEVFDLLQQEGSIKIDNLVLEINSSKHANAVSVAQVIQSVLTSILEIASTEVVESDNSAKELLREIKKSLSKFKELLKRYIKLDNLNAQKDCLSSLESMVLQKPHFLPIVHQIIHHMYDEDILGEDAICDWFKRLPESTEVKAKVEKLIEWFEEEEDEGSESSSDEE